MLPGNETVSFSMSLQIALVGMCIVMLELAILSLFVLILSKLMSNLSAKKVAVAAPVAAPVPAPVATPAVVPVPVIKESEDEIAAVMIAVAEESGYSLNEIVFKSIEEKK